MKNLFFLLCIFFTQLCNSQDIIINGFVRDKDDNSPIHNVNISISGTNQGCSSNEKGIFELKVSKLPTNLKITHIAYHSQNITVTKDNLVGQKIIKISIILASKSTNLKEVSIHSKPAYKLERLVYDFEISDSLVYVISNRKDNKFLQVYTAGDYLIGNTFLPKECNRIDYDYSNNLRVRNSNKENYYKVLLDKSYKINLKKEEYDVIELGILRTINNGDNFSSEGVTFHHPIFYKKVPFFLDKYIHILPGFNNSRFFYCYDFGNKFIYMYKIFEKNNKLKYTLIYHSLYDIDDWLKDKGKSFGTILPKSKLHTSYDSVLMIVNNHYDLFIDINSYEKVQSIKKELYERLFKYQIFSHVPPHLKSPNMYPELLITYSMSFHKRPYMIKQMDSNIYIFNFERMILYKLSDKGLPLSQNKIDSSFYKGYLGISDILINQEQTKCYIKYENFPKIELKEIDLSTGKYIKSINLPFLTEKIRIMGSNIYYTIKQSNGSIDDRLLYKQKLK